MATIKIYYWKKYFFKYIKYTIITFFVGGIVYLISRYFIAINYIEWIIKSVILGTLTLVLVILLTFKSSEYKVLSNNVKDIILKIKRKIGGSKNEKNS